jgi:hypothetical protein
LNKNTLAVFAIVLLLVSALMPTPAYAADQLLVIDSSHVYAGMELTYGQGYAPKLSAEEATVRMPLVVSQIYKGAVQGDSIMVSPDLGDPQSSPFIAGDLSQAVTLKEYNVQDEQGGRSMQKAYYIVLYLPLQADRINGKYPVVLHISYLNDLGLSIQQSFSVDVVITDGVDSAQSGENQNPLSQILIPNYEVTPSVVQAGTGLSVDFTLQNAGKSGAATNILVTYNSETDDIKLKGSTGTIFVSSIEKGASLICHIEMDAQDNAKTGMHRIFVNVAYTDEKGSAVSASFEIPVMVRQPVRLQYGSPSIPAEATLGNDVMASLLISNSGMDTLYDVAVSLQSDGFISSSDTFLGNMESGAKKTASIIAKPSGEPREANGRLVVSYEDENGMQYTDEVPFESRILPSATVYWRLPLNWRIIAALIIAGCATIAVYLLYKNRKKEDRSE